MCQLCNAPQCDRKKKSSKCGGCVSKSIRQSQIDRNGGTYVISSPGNYNLAEDVSGTILISSMSVCLDLCCHIINANGRPNAIVIQGDSSPSQIVPNVALRSGPIVRNAAIPKVSKTVIPKVSKIGSSVSKSVPTEDDFSALDANVDIKAFQPTSNFDENILYQLGYKARNLVPSNIAGSNIWHVKVFNGSIIGATDAGILVNTCYDISLYDLHFLSNPAGQLNSIEVKNSNVIQMDNIQFFGSSGSSAVKITSSDNISIRNVNVTKFTNLQPLLQFLSCNNVKLETVNVTDNTKSISQISSGFGDPIETLVYFGASTGIELEEVKVNRNTVTSSISPTTNLRFLAIAFNECNSCFLNKCEISNNTDMAAVRDYLLTVFNSSNFIISKLRSNNNISEAGRSSSFRNIQITDSSNVIIQDSQICQNLASTDNLSVISFAKISTDISANYEIKNCQISSNINTFATGQFVGILCSSHKNIYIKNCNISDSSSNDTNGIVLATTSNVVIEGCNIADMRSTLVSRGININSNSTVISNCVVEDINTSGSDAVGITFSTSNNNVVKNCTVCKVSAPTNASGINFQSDSINNIVENSTVLDLSGATARGIRLATSNNLVKNCDIIDILNSTTAVAIDVLATSSNTTLLDNNISSLDGTGQVIGINSSGSGVSIMSNNVKNINSSGSVAAGIRIASTDTNLVDNTSFNVSGTTASLGYTIDGTKNVNLIRNTSSNNVSGFSTSGIPSGAILFEDNIATNNSGVGFAQSVAVAPTVRYIGNVASFNTTNYSLTAIVPFISLQTLSGTGNFTNINGNAALGSRFTNLSII